MSQANEESLLWYFIKNAIILNFVLLLFWRNECQKLKTQLITELP